MVDKITLIFHNRTFRNMYFRNLYLNIKFGCNLLDKKNAVILTKPVTKFPNQCILRSCTPAILYNT